MSTAEDRIRVTYRLAVGNDQAAALARRIAWEQTVELPEAVVTDPHVLEQVVGQVESVLPAGCDFSDARISFSAPLGALHLSQLLNLVFGNVSLYPGVRLTGLQLPASVLAGFVGPRYGSAGVRALIGVHGRPLLATALKPQGTTNERLAAMAGAFARGGGDIVKDDQNLIDDFIAFRERVMRCADAVFEANATTGRRCLYLPHVAGDAMALREGMHLVRELGLPGVLVCPMIAGLDTTRKLADELDLMVMAHPAMTGTYTNAPTGGIDHGVLLGTLFRLAGADISIFPDPLGRFSFSEEQCAAISTRLREPLGEQRANEYPGDSRHEQCTGLAPALPAPAGGIRFDNLAALSDRYGEDAVLLIGGNLLDHAPDLAVGTRAFIDRLEALHTNTRYATPAADTGPTRSPTAGRHLVFSPDYAWAHRPSSPYKDADDDSFRGVRRVELVGKYGERTNTDLRYFEVEPGGHSSREFHLHTHVVIGARGEGVLVIGNDRMTLRVNDVAWIEAHEIHQLRNETDQPFGFYCIVDHERDRPIRT